MLARLANLIDKNGQRLASQWVDALRESGNRVFAAQDPEVFWRTALTWVAHLLEALRSGDLASPLRTFDVTAKRLALSGQPLSDTVQLLTTFRQVLWRLIEEQGTREGVSPHAAILELTPFFDATEHSLICEYDSLWAQADSAPAGAPAVAHAEALSRAAEQEAILSRLAQEMAAQYDVSKLADVIARGAAQLVGARRAGVTLYDPAEGELRYQAGYYLPRLAMATSIAMGKGLSGAAGATGEMQVAVDMPGHDDPSFRSAARRLRVRSGVSVPLRGQHGMIGTLDVFDPVAPTFWTKRELALLTELSSRAARALDNARLVADMRRRARRLSRLNDANRAFAGRHTPRGLTKALVEAACELIRGQAAAAWLLQPGSDVMRLAVRHNAPRGVPTSVRRGEGLLGKAAERGSPRVVRATGRQAGEVHRLLGTHSVALLPLHKGREIAGLLAIWDKRSGALNQDDLQWLLALDNQFAAALRNLELRLETRHYAEDLQTSVTQLGASLASPLKLDDLLTLIADLTAQVAGVPLCLVAVRDNDGKWHTRADGRTQLPPERAAELGESLATQVVRGRKIVVFGDGPDLEPLPEADLAEAGVEAVLGLPVTIKRTTVGALLVGAAQARTFTVERRQLFASFAAQAAVAVENVQLFDNVQYQLSMLTDLTWLSAKISGTLDLNAILPTIAQAVAQGLDVPMAAVFLREGSLLRIPPKGHYGVPVEWAQEIKVPVETSVVSDVMERGAPRAVADTVKAGMLDHPLVQGPGARAFACVPLGSDRGNVGMVYVADNASRAFRLHQIALLSAYANQAALAVQNARLYAEAVTQSEQVSTLHDVILAVTSTLDLDESLHRLAEAACRLLDVPIATIRLLDESRQVLRARAVHGMPLNDRFAADLPVSRSLLGETIERRVPVASRDIWRDGRFQRRDLARALGLRSILAAPLVAKGMVLGVISAYTRELRDFGETEIRLLRTLALEAGIAIENAQLYEQARERARFLSTLMQEAHHRVRNNLQVVSGLLAMQISQVSEESTQRILRQTIDRINSIALVHEILSQERVGEVDLKETATRIGELARRSVLSAEQKVSVQVVGARVCLPSRQATSAALAINELVTNALQHGFPDGAQGTVTISLQQQGGEVLIQVRDDGAGLPPGFDMTRDRHSGLDIVEGLVTRELGGTLALDSDHGTIARLRFSAPPPSDQVVASPTRIGQSP